MEGFYGTPVLCTYCMPGIYNSCVLRRYSGHVRDVVLYSLLYTFFKVLIIVIETYNI